MYVLLEKISIYLVLMLECGVMEINSEENLQHVLLHISHKVTSTSTPMKDDLYCNEMFSYNQSISTIEINNKQENSQVTNPCYCTIFHYKKHKTAVNFEIVAEYFYNVVKRWYELWRFKYTYIFPNSPTLVKFKVIPQSDKTPQFVVNDKRTQEKVKIKLIGSLTVYVRCSSREYVDVTTMTNSDSSTSSNTSPISIYIIIAVISFIVLIATLILCIICILYTKKKRKDNNNEKDVQMNEESLDNPSDHNGVIYAKIDTDQLVMKPKVNEPDGSENDKNLTYADLTLHNNQNKSRNPDNNLNTQNEEQLRFLSSADKTTVNLNIYANT